MIRHILMLWLKDCSEQNLRRVTGLIKRLSLSVKGLLELEVERPILGSEDGCHLCVSMRFESEAALSLYLSSAGDSVVARWVQGRGEKVHWANYRIQEAGPHMPRLYAFIGPANRDEETLAGLLRAGMRGIRLSLLHHGPAECEPIVRALFAAAGTGEPPEILLDDIQSGISDTLDRLHATGLMAPLMYTRRTLVDLKRLIGPGRRLYVKIEREEDLSAIGDALSVADEIVIHRGALLRNLPYARLPAVQRRVARMARAAGKPFMVAAELLPSMRGSLVPSAGELSDIHTAVLEGASSMMLGGEVALGHYPVEAMRVLRDTCRAASA